MRFGWHKSWLVGFALGGCVLNPQPDLPGESGAQTPGVATSGAGGKSSSDGRGGGLSAGGSGAGAVGVPGSSGSLNIGAAGQSAEADAGAGGAPELGEAGAGGEAGSPQLAPGPAR